MYTKLLDKQTKLALIGLGYVGLPIAMEFAKHVSVIGFDINEDRLDKLRNGIDPCGELSSEVFEHHIYFFYREAKGGFFLRDSCSYPDRQP
mgnify:CR=1 FL=1